MPIRTSRTCLNQIECSRAFSSSWHAVLGAVCPPRQFSTTAPTNTALRRAMWRWMNGPGRKFRDPLPGSTNYLGAYDTEGNLRRVKRVRQKEQEKRSANQRDTEEAVEADEDAGEDGLPPGVERHELRDESNLAAGTRELLPEGPRDLQPFPLNQNFRSQPVLSEELREEVFRRVTKQGKSPRVVSAELGVDMNRVGAVVRLKTLEKEWVEKGRKLATPYNRAVLSMLPTTPLRDRPFPHESINDLPTHSATLQQIFHPTSESRAFTRTDAGRVFADNLLPADERIPHPELIELERERQMGLPRDERIARQRARAKEEATVRAARDAKAKATPKTTVTPTAEGGKGGRWQWNVQHVTVDRHTVGANGRAPTGPGSRYGVPHNDRKKHVIKIPQRVE